MSGGSEDLVFKNWKGACNGRPSFIFNQWPLLMRVIEKTYRLIGEKDDAA
ncbi:hypothetical protein GGR96_000568 [Thalassospira tepidiphila]|uniref:Uncharacterized protein n=1 Tax=Thalassospira tepidiphila TaxID=393657 RepID=A0ABX0WW18_9PROT|nr:hypothetical protein [Thalassospira tepidiphila]